MYLSIQAKDKSDSASIFCANRLNWFPFSEVMSSSHQITRVVSKFPLSRPGRELAVSSTYTYTQLKIKIPKPQQFYVITIVYKDLAYNLIIYTRMYVPADFDCQSPEGRAPRHSECEVCRGL